MDIRIIKGGLDAPDRYKYRQGCVTDTRLMGVLGMHLEWEDTKRPDEPDFHQYYYFDCEELGLERLSFLRSSNKKLTDDEQTRVFAGLGAAPQPLSEREARYLVCYMVLRTKTLGQALPFEASQIKYITDFPPELSGGEYNHLQGKINVPVKSDYGVINYYYMRCFGKDPEAALPFVSEMAKPEEIEDITPALHATFFRNRIETLETGGQRRSYRCESLVQVDDEAKHYLIVSRVDVYKRKIISLEKVSSQYISPFEASMILNRPEFVTVYGVFGPFDFCSEFFEKSSIAMTKTRPPAGDMYLDYLPDNSYAENKTFCLNDDVSALYYVGDAGEFVVASYSLDGIAAAERKMQRLFGLSLAVKGRFRFQTSLMYDFAESGVDFFRDYLDALGI